MSPPSDVLWIPSQEESTGGTYSLPPVGSYGLHDHVLIISAFSPIFYLPPLRHLQSGQWERLIRGRIDGLEDMMVAEENGGVYLSHTNSLLTRHPPEPSFSLSPSCIFKELRGHSESEWTMTTGRCSPHLLLSRSSCLSHLSPSISHN